MGFNRACEGNNSGGEVYCQFQEILIALSLVCVESGGFPWIVNALQVEESARAQIIAPTQRDVMLLDLTCQGSTVPSSLNPTQSYLIR